MKSFTGKIGLEPITIVLETIILPIETIFPSIFRIQKYKNVLRALPATGSPTTTLLRLHQSY